MRRLTITAPVIVLGLALALAASSTCHAQSGESRHDRTLQVFAAASLADAFSEIGHRLEATHPGLTVRMNFAGSQQLAAQIEQGAAADVFASADERWTGYLRDRGLLSGTSSVFARNRLIVIVPRTNPARIRRLQDLARGGVKLVLGADAVPVGHYTRTVLRNLSHEPGFGPLFGASVLRNVASEEENVKSIVGKVQLGEADAGIVYRSDVTPAVARFIRVIEIPEHDNILASYPIALVKDARQANDGLVFLEFVLSPEGQQVLERNGLIPAAPTTP